MNNKFGVKIDGTTYGLKDVKEWANELEVKPIELVEKMTGWDAKQWAIFAYTNFSEMEIDAITDLGNDIGTDTVDVYGEELNVLTDDEADDLWDEELDSYIDDCLEIPDYIRPYFDEEKWKDDARMDGRGHCISRYDGYENEFKIEFEETGESDWIYIYRQN